ncbi:MAG: hypothetical protein AAF316_07210 [Cyanobacteria bacterium P01_A01_bin.80]
MYRLNKKAYSILVEEVQRCAGNDQVGKTEKYIVIARLERMCKEKGEPANVDELGSTIFDVYPQFSDNILKKASEANQPPTILDIIIRRIAWTIVLLSIPSGIIWLINLPYPMIRKPVAEKAPILLLPSYISMDNSYRRAIDSLEQAEQLLTRSTSTADVEMGAIKVKEAQKHLENLPVWFLGYYPKAYCGIFRCTWKFTFDEFEIARRRAGKLEAIAFQGTNALTPLKKAEVEVTKAQKQYEQAKNIKDREKAIAKWQNAISQFDQIPRQTLAGKDAAAKIKGYRQQYQNALVASYISAAQEFDAEAQRIRGTQSQAASQLWQQAVIHLQKVPKENPRYVEAQKLSAFYQAKFKTVVNSYGGSYIEGAKQFALAAAQQSQNPPHSAAKWGEIARLWGKAIQQLERIGVKEPGYVEAQKLLAEYQTNLGIIKTRQKLEVESQEVFKKVNITIQNLNASPPSDPRAFKAQIQGIISQLRTIPSGTTVYKEAQQLIKSASERL